MAGCVHPDGGGGAATHTLPRRPGEGPGAHPLESRAPAPALPPDLHATLASAGLAVLRGFLAPDQVAALRATADALAAAARAADEAAAGGADLGPAWAARHRGCILETAPSTPGACARSDPGLGRALAALGAAALGGDGGGGPGGGGGSGGGSGGGGRGGSGPASVRLLNEQFIVKPPRCPASAFAWHTDGQYCRGREAEAEAEGQGEGEGGGDGAGRRVRRPYLSVWVPLDAVGPANGTLEVEGRAARAAGLVAAAAAASGAGGPPPPPATVAVVAAPGDAIVMLSTTPHGSGPNLGDAPRRVWMPQLCVGVEEEADGAARLAGAE